MGTENRKRIKLLNPKATTLYPTKMLSNDGLNSVNWNDIRYPQFGQYYHNMLEKFWIPEEVKMGKDNLDYISASEDIKEAYKLGLGNLTAIDVVQTRMANIISLAITDPAISACYAVVAQQEAVHAQSYSYAKQDKLSITEQNESFKNSVSYETAMNRNQLVIDVLEEVEDAYKLFMFNELSEKEFAHKLAKGVVSVSVLEGINFYSTFMMFYYLKHRYGILDGTAQIITYIHRDEFTHSYLSGHTHRALLTDYPMTKEEEDEHMEWALNFIKENVKREIEYGLDLFTKVKAKPSEIDTYCHWLGNIRAQALGLPLPFPDYPYTADENPIPWMKAFSDKRLDSGKKTDFFESVPTQYSKATSESTDLSDDDFEELEF